MGYGRRLSASCTESTVAPTVDSAPQPRSTQRRSYGRLSAAAAVDSALASAHSTAPLLACGRLSACLGSLDSAAAGLRSTQRSPRLTRQRRCWPAVDSALASAHPTAPLLGCGRLSACRHGVGILACAEARVGGWMGGCRAAGSCHGVQPHPPWTRRPGHGVLVTASWSRRPGHGVLVTASWSRGPGHGVLVTGDWSRLPGHGVLVTGAWSRLPGHVVLVTAFWSRCPGRSLFFPGPPARAASRGIHAMGHYYRHGDNDNGGMLIDSESMRTHIIIMIESGSVKDEARPPAAAPARHRPGSRAASR
jgi:hypothetical protein